MRILCKLDGNACIFLHFQENARILCKLGENVRILCKLGENAHIFSGNAHFMQIR